MKSGKCNASRKRDHDSDDAIVAVLWDGPLTMEEIEEQFLVMMHRFGMFDHFVKHWADQDKKWDEELADQVSNVVDKGYVRHEGERYYLTESGRDKAAHVIEDMRKMGRILKRLSQPQIVSRISLWSCLGLSLVKIPAALLSGSIGLLNDAFDTLLDAVSGLLVYAGVHWKIQKLTNLILVAVMLVTGFFAFFMAMQRFFFAEMGPMKWFALVAAIISALVYTILLFYQRFIGLKSGNLSLITQSVNSRNHIIVSVAVIAGIISAMFGTSIPDNLVGLVVALIILKNAVEVAWEVWKSEDEFVPELQRYNMFFADKVTNWQDKHYLLWLLYLVHVQNLTSRDQLLDACKRSMDYSSNIVLRETGLATKVNIETRVDNGLEKLFKNGWLQGSTVLNITDTGKEQLEKWI